MTKPETQPGVTAFSELALVHLQGAIDRNEAVMKRLAEQLVTDVEKGHSLLVFGSGHSALFPMELYHRAGGAAFVLPIVGDYLLPTAGPPVVRMFERAPGSANPLLSRVEPRAGEMLWLASQSGINAAVVDLALEGKRRGLRTVAFTSVTHSRSVASRHASGKRLFEVCDEVVDFGGFAGDACVPLTSPSGDVLRAGPLSALTMILLGHSIVTAACAKLEAKGHRCVYASVNTSEGEHRNKNLEAEASKRDVLLR